MKKYCSIFLFLLFCANLVHSQTQIVEEREQHTVRAIGVKSYFLNFPYGSTGADYSLLYCHRVNDHTFELGPVWVEHRDDLDTRGNSSFNRLGLNLNYQYFPNGRENTFNLFLASSLHSVYYELDFFGFNSANRGRRTANNYENSFLLGFGMDVPFLQHFNFNIAYSLKGTYLHRQFFLYGNPDPGKSSDNEWQRGRGALGVGLNYRFSR